VDVCGEDGELLPASLEVLKLVGEYEAVLATGHVSRDEHFAVARARGAIPVLVTHAMEPLAGPNLSIEDCVALANLGATIELTALTCLGAMASRPIEDIVACARAVGPDRCTLGTDYGQKANPRPAEGLQSFADALAAAGLEEKEIRTMACTVPCRLLGLAG
jgi:microsomal dipeptidase-like Zn-dependent dipeptidase